MADTNENIDERNGEILSVWKYLRTRRNHTAKWCRQFIARNYKMSEGNLYKIMTREDYFLSKFNVNEATIIYHIVMEDRYMDYEPFED